MKKHGGRKKGSKNKVKVSLITGTGSEVVCPEKYTKGSLSGVNNLCKNCTQACKQFKQITIIHCPNRVRNPKISVETIANDETKEN